MRIYTALIVSLCALICGFVLLGGAVWFALFVMESQANTIVTSTQIADERRRSAYVASVRALLRDTEKEREQLKAIVGTQDLVQTIQVLEDAALAAKVRTTVDAVSAGGDIQEDLSLESYLVSLRVEGTFPAIMHFIALLNTLPQPTNVEFFLVENTGGQWGATVQTRVYIHKTKQSTPIEVAPPIQENEE